MDARTAYRQVKTLTADLAAHAGLEVADGETLFEMPGIFNDKDAAKNVRNHLRMSRPHGAYYTLNIALVVREELDNCTYVFATITDEGYSPS